MIVFAMTVNEWLDSTIKAVALAVACISAVVALQTYKANRRTKVAEFLLQLHEAFFVQETYKKVRDVLDSDAKSSTVTLDALIKKESAGLTDFLNFFELVAYFVKSGTLSSADAEGLLGYYFDILSGKTALRGYIDDTSRGFEHLASYLKERSAKKAREASDG